MGILCSACGGCLMFVVSIPCEVFPTHLSSSCLGHARLATLQTVAERLAAENRSIRGQLEQYLAGNSVRSPMVADPRSHGASTSRFNSPGAGRSPNTGAVDTGDGGRVGGLGTGAATKGAWEDVLQAQVSTPRPSTRFGGLVVSEEL